MQGPHPPAALLYQLLTAALIDHPTRHVVVDDKMLERMHDLQASGHALLLHVTKDGLIEARLADHEGVAVMQDRVAPTADLIVRDRDTGAIFFATGADDHGAL